MGKKKDLTGSLAVVTGASSGIGLAFCRELASRGCSLMMVSNQPEALAQFSAEIREAAGIGVHVLDLDLTLPDAAERICSALDSRGLDADILVNNAGIFAFAPLGELTERRVDAFIDLHVRAVTALSRTFALRFKSRGGGRILNMSSMSCWMPMPGLSMYAATKAYIRVLSRSLHYEMRGTGVRVTAACPGGIATDLFGLPPKLMRLAVAIKAVQTPERFVGRAVDKMLAGKMQYINGALNRLSIPLVGAAPTPVRMLVKSLMLDKGIRR